MKINNEYIGQTKFSELNIGDVFLWSESQIVCMKINEVTNIEDCIINNAVNLEEGNTLFFNKNDYVIRVSAELTIS
jgi:hypothetical protein